LSGVVGTIRQDFAQGAGCLRDVGTGPSGGLGERNELGHDFRLGSDFSFELGESGLGVIGLEDFGQCLLYESEGFGEATTLHEHARFLHPLADPRPAEAGQIQHLLVPTIHAVERVARYGLVGGRSEGDIRNPEKAGDNQCDQCLTRASDIG
jgi:hypothetical protein